MSEDVEWVEVDQEMLDTIYNIASGVVQPYSDSVALETIVELVEDGRYYKKWLEK